VTDWLSSGSWSAKHHRGAPPPLTWVLCLGLAGLWAPPAVVAQEAAPAAADSDEDSGEASEAPDDGEASGVPLVDDGENQGPRAGRNEPSPEDLSLDAPLVTDITVEGNQRVSEADVRATIRTAVGRALRLSQVRRDVQALYDLEFFEDITVESRPDGEGVALVFRVIERPNVQAVVVEGNDAVKEEDIKEVIDIEENSILRIPKVREVVQRITELYAEKGFFLAEIDYEVVPHDRRRESDDNRRRLKRSAPAGAAKQKARRRSRANEVDVIFRIKEGDKIRVRSVNFVGNEALSDSALRNTIQTREWGFFSFLTKSGTFRREALEQDVTLLQARYYDEGYLNVHVGTPRVSMSADRRYLDVSVPIEEGERYKIGRVRVREVDGRGQEMELLGGRVRVREMIRIRRGAYFSRQKIGTDLERVQAHYRDAGYANVNIEPRTALNEEGRIVDLTFQIERGELVHIERINIRGNEKTRDRVIRREMLIAEGDLYNDTRIKTSKRRVEALGYFETVELSTRRGSRDDLMEINIEVAERPTGTFQVGAGFSSQEQFILTAQISQQNLFGRGQSLSLQGQISGLRQIFQLQFTEPYFLDTKWILSVNAFNMARFYEGFSSTSTGGTLGFGYPVLPDLRLYLSYTGQYVDVSTKSTGTFLPSSSIYSANIRNVPLADLFSDGFSSSLRGSVTYDTRNNRMFPTRGTYNSLSVQVASPYLGSETEFVRWQAFSRWYFPLFWNFVLRINLEGGLIYNPSGRVAIYERFFEGGIYSVRGYRLRSLGPRLYSVPADLDPNQSPIAGGLNIGGNLSVVSQVEIEFPIVPQVNIRGVVFFDAGNAFNMEGVWCEHSQGNVTNEFSDPCLMKEPWMLRTSVGFGFRWFSPLGPLRFEWGIPLNRQEGEEKIDFQFTIGNVF
jgi:outer membrane protein insertion porin family